MNRNETKTMSIMKSNFRGMVMIIHHTKNDNIKKKNRIMDTTEDRLHWDKGEEGE